MLARRQRPLDRKYGNYGIGDGGVKSKVLLTFGEMLKHGAIANEESFTNVITASAREGDITTVKAVLRKVWDVDVDALLNTKDESTLAPKEKLAATSPLHPSSRLLFAIAHAFGINNDLPTALRTVDFVARTYSIPIDLATWSQLFEWTFVLAVPRTGVKAKTDGTRQGRLPKQSVLSLWNTMTGAPYHVKPTMGMYNYLVKNLQHREFASEMVEKMYEGLKVHRQERREGYVAWGRMEKVVTGAKVEDEDKDHDASKLWDEALDETNDNTTTTTTATRVVEEPIESLRRDWEYRDLLRRRNIFWLKRWLRLFLSLSRTRLRTDISQDWSLRLTPRILWDWRVFAPTLVRYEVPGGLVEMRFRTEEEIAEKRASRAEKEAAKKRVVDAVPMVVGRSWGRGRTGGWERRSGVE